MQHTSLPEKRLLTALLSLLAGARAVARFPAPPRAVEARQERMTNWPAPGRREQSSTPAYEGPPR